MLQFLSQWLAYDPGRLAASLEEFVGNPAYGIQHLRSDLERFVFLLGGSDGDPSSAHDCDSRPAETTPGLAGLNVVRPRAARCGRCTLTPAAAPACTDTYPGQVHKPQRGTR